MPNVQMGLIGRKLGMTQFFDAEGEVVPVTVVNTGPNTVIRVKSSDSKDRYAAVQLGFGERRASRDNKALAGHAARAGVKSPQRLQELRIPEELTGQYSAGQTLGAADVFAVGDLVDVVGTSKGRGFSGVMRRHHFHGFVDGHGTHEYFRHGGSIGTRLTPGMTLAGKRMPGHMGAERATIQNLKVVRVDAEKNLLYIRGGIPGPTGAWVVVRRSTKAAARAAHKAAKGR